MDFVEPAGSGKTVKKNRDSLFEIRKNCINLPETPEASLLCFRAIHLHLTIQPREN